jgi:sulfofructose kinase
MSTQTCDVYGLGQICWDYIAQMDTYPLPDSKSEISSLFLDGGGPVATALVALSRWGLSCSLCGVVGDDSHGEQLLDSLKEEQVNTENVFIRKNSHSQIAFIITEKTAGSRTIFWRRPTGPVLRPEEPDYKIIKNARMVYTDGLFLEASLAVARVAKEAGIPVVVDAGTLREGSLRLAPLSDYYIVAQSFARSLIGEENPRKACLELQKLGPSVVGVTLGNRGYIVLSDNHWIEGPAYSVNTIDTTGCGDVFHAGIAYGVLNKWKLEKTLDFAAWAAAQVSTRLGGRSGIPAVKNYKPQDND